MISFSPRQLEAFAAVAMHGSVRAAAEHLHLTQPALSMALSELERHLDTRVFDRERGRLRLNEQGRELLPRVREILDRMQALQDWAGAVSGQLQGELNLGASNTVGNYLVGELVGDFVARHPQVTLQLRVANTDAIVGDVLAHRLDLGCVEGPVTHPRLERLPWREDELVVCSRPDHPLARRRRLRARDFNGMGWILREPGSATRALSETVLAQLPDANVVMELGQVEAIKQAVSAGLGIACLPRVAVTEAALAGRLAILDTPFLDMRRQLSLVMHKARYHGQVMRAFLESALPEPDKPTP
ncbi:LysR substrate-binding domain-containing protein [Oleiagrimonas sp.]|jgi:DNA-binding transcriptional LysR family regulator|uniref:LysR substrate-binding domain-containing protein n=1 Tax=Oleiagrimonas sp. TaxID=2010330 RepID=UPI002614D477|nr:LysR substrate-binding domain-containing protein [Oleiagrimonas sp.]MDA3912612.1 LysR substrate-binding domain-containing protein [Oleiagrimonas sp.]